MGFNHSHGALQRALRSPPGELQQGKDRRRKALYMKYIPDRPGDTNTHWADKKIHSKIAVQHR